MSRHLHQGALNRKMLIAALVDCANACTNSDKPAVGCRGDSRPGDRSIDASRMPRRSDNAGPGPSITAETVLRDVPIHDWTAATRRSDRPPEGSDNGHVEPSLWSATGTCGSARGRLCGTRTAEQELTEQPAAVNRNEGRRVLAIGQTRRSIVSPRLPALATISGVASTGEQCSRPSTPKRATTCAGARSANTNALDTRSDTVLDTRSDSGTWPEGRRSPAGGPLCRISEWPMVAPDG